MIIQDATSSCSEVSIFSSVSSSGVGVGSWSGFCLRSEGEWGDFVSPRVPGTVYYNVVPCRNTNQLFVTFLGKWINQPIVTRVTSSVFFCLQKSLDFVPSGEQKTNHTEPPESVQAFRSRDPRWRRGTCRPLRRNARWPLRGNPPPAVLMTNEPMWSSDDSWESKGTPPMPPPSRNSRP